ncbi:hypothetical protein WH52_11635 [Tenacibaculum holothuriorum]|uniref:tRNA (Guanine-N1)-methyltransferase n=1 Tax=Tenacibaculum holothuriorum TaxID=1635173 RepID=A0A1Y2PCU3_9FLAO|nr:hypothetical protein [Tenacibaculum holothuriorum]OSY87508.1 hypothetical protein WH52_11635 [Tenacibaculum holothuriorum]
MKTIKTLAFALTLIGTSINAQEVTQLPNTVENQFKELYKKSNNYQIYKVVKKNEFLTLQKNVTDSISVLKKDIVTKQKHIDTHLNSIKSLQAKISTLNTDLTTSIEKEDAISFVGIPLQKGTYNTIMWSAILGLFAALAFFIYKFNNSNSVTKETKDALVDVENEFEAHKKKALEREQKLRRQLQDEINKQRGV